MSRYATVTNVQCSPDHCDSEGGSLAVYTHFFRMHTLLARFLVPVPVCCYVMSKRAKLEKGRVNQRFMRWRYSLDDLSPLQLARFFRNLALFGMTGSNKRARKIDIKNTNGLICNATYVGMTNVVLRLFSFNAKISRMLCSKREIPQFSIFVIHLIFIKYNFCQSCNMEMWLSDMEVLLNDSIKLQLVCMRNKGVISK